MCANYVVKSEISTISSFLCDTGTYFKSLTIITNEDTLAKDKYMIDNNNLLFILSFK